MALTVLGVAGSLRAGSFNRALLAAAVELAPSGMVIRPWEAERLAAIPPYDADLEARGVPEPVEALRGAMRAADGILIATPEYNHSIPGVLKNAIDWASRPAGKAAYGGKPVAILGATPGIGGTIRGQLALRQALDSDTHILPAPEVFVARAGEKFDAAGRLVDETTRRFVAGHLLAFEAWIQRLRTSSRTP